MKGKIHFYLMTVMAVSIVAFTLLTYASEDDSYESG